MGIYAAPPDGQPRPRPGPTTLAWVAIGLAVASIVTFALVGGAGLDRDWLVLALAEALLAFVLLVRSR
jgi:hypothetical protein